MNESENYQAYSSVPSASSLTPSGQPVPPAMPAPSFPPLPKGKFGKSKLLLSQSLKTLGKDKSLLGVQLVGVVVSITLSLTIAAILFIYFTTIGNVDSSDTKDTGALSLLAYALFIAATSIIFTTLSTYIATAVSYGALKVFDGQNVSISDCLYAANNRFGSILAFGAFSGVIGAILRLIEDRLGSLAATITTRLIGAAWSIATMFVPAIIANSQTHVGPLEAAKSSVGVIKKTWGESLILTIGIGIVTSWIMVGYIFSSMALSFTVGVITNSGLAVIGMAGLAIIGLFALSLGISTLGAIVNAALFYYATHGRAPSGFNPQLLQEALKPRKKKAAVQAS